MKTKEHGVTIREKKTNKLIRFFPCETGQPALRILGGIKTNLDFENYKASEEYINKEELSGVENE
jgi:hypothetical protein